jgi:ribonuclease P protein component
MKNGGFAGISSVPHASPHLWTKRVVATHFIVVAARSAVDNSVYDHSGTLARQRPLLGGFFRFSRLREADLPAQRTPAEASPRFSRAHVVACRTGDSQASPRKGPEASVRLIEVHKRNRLSRSRDFDAVYRQGRSTATRFLVLYWFDREDEPGEARLGLAVPRAAGNAVARNKVKRQLRELWRARLERIPAGRDYVLIAKPGLPEAVQANGFDWLGARVDEVLQKAAA